MERRLGIFVIYDPDGIVDRYREYLLNDIIENLSELIIVCNGFMLEIEVEKLRRYTSKIYIRENKGFDAGAIKAALCDYIGWDEVREYDELVILNDTFYGPLYPLKIMFDEMEMRDLDFWGITRNKQPLDHIQTFFYVVRRTLLTSDEFMLFWINLDIKSWQRVHDAVYMYELVITEHFEKFGYRWGVYIDTVEYEKRKSNPIAMSHRLLLERNSPILKYKALISGDNDETTRILPFTNERSILAIKYIQEHTEYDLSMIWEHLLRRYPIDELIQNLELYYVLITSLTTLQEKKDLKIGAILHIGYTDLLDECVNNIINIPEFIDIYITVLNHDFKMALLEQIGIASRSNVIVELIDNDEKKYSPFPAIWHEQLQQYDYICYVSDKENNSYEDMFILWHNAFASLEYILNIVDTFEKNKSLGILTTPMPFAGNYLVTLHRIKEKATIAAASYAGSIGLRIKPSSLSNYHLNTDAFWCRPSALKMLFEYQFNHMEKCVPDEGEIRYLIPFIAQHEGFYTGILMSDIYAKKEISNKTVFALATYSELFNDPFFLDSSLPHVIKSLKTLVWRSNEHLKDYPSIYLYGAGEIGTRYYKKSNNLGIDISGFIVSDGQKKKESHLGIPIYELGAMIEKRDTCHILIAVGRAYYQEVRKNLENAGFVNILN